MEWARMAFGHVIPSAVLSELGASAYLVLSVVLFSVAVKLCSEALVQGTTLMDWQVE